MPPKTTRAKKEKKPIQVVAVVTPAGIEGTFAPEPRKPLIVHLPFQSSEVEFTSNAEIRYNPNPPMQPEPYEDESRMYFEVNQEGANESAQVGVEVDGWKMAPIPAAIRSQLHANSEADTSNSEEKPEQVVDFKKPEIEEKKVSLPKTAKLLLCYASKPNEVFKVPSSTNVHCFWTTLPFTTQPYFIPVKEESGVYTVYGNFSRVECALAYLLQERIDSHVRWERVSLLHRMYGARGRIYPAPSPQSLQMYGGPFTEEHFFQAIDEKKIRVDIQQPPMVSILSTLDTKPVDFYDSITQTALTGGFSADRFKAWSEQGGALRLKRSKPLKDKESTLDSILSISRPGDVLVSF